MRLNTENESDLSRFKSIPVLLIARKLGIKVRGKKAMCFNGHDKASPSLSFFLRKNTWRCFGACGKHGDGINLVMEVLGVDFKTAFQWLETEFGIEVNIGRTTNRMKGRRPVTRKPTRLSSVVIHEDDEFAADQEVYTWLIGHCKAPSRSLGMDYLKTHGIDLETAASFSLRELTKPRYAFDQLVAKWGKERVFRSGLAWGKNDLPEALIWSSYALLFPVLQNGEVIYIQARMFAGRQKFIGLRGVEKPLFNAERVAQIPSGSLVHLCEGAPDTISLEAEGLNAVGVLGATSFRSKWVDSLLKYDLVVLGDGDPGGKAFQRTISKLFRERGKSVHCVNLPRGQDVADVLSQIRKLR